MRRQKNTAPKNTAPKTGSRHIRDAVRSLVAVAVICLGLVGLLGASAVAWGGSWTPQLGLDLEGGTQMILQPQVSGGQSVNPEQLAQAADIMRARVDGQGVAEAEVSTLGNNVVVSIPGALTEQQENALRQSSQMRFRPVLLVAPNAPPEAVPEQVPGQPSGEGATPTVTPTGTARPTPTGTARPTPAPSGPRTQGAGAEGAGAALPGALRLGAAAPATPSPSPAPTGPLGLPTEAPAGAPRITDEEFADPTKRVEYATSEAWITPDWQARLIALDCTAQEAYDPSRENPRLPTVACGDDGSAKYLLGPAVLSGEDIADASSGPTLNQQTGQPTGGYQVNLRTNSDAVDDYAQISGYMVTQPEPRNQLAVVLDNNVVSAPRFESAIPNGEAQITGNFTQETAQLLADQLKFGALPMSFEVQSTEQISPTVGGDQLAQGIVAGLIGLALVVAYFLWQYRALGLVTVASLVLVAGLTYAMLALFGWAYNLRLTMAGVTGAIVAIGTTADSFIVYFERVRDEVRDGRRLESAVQNGWERAKRTILISDGVSLLAAVILYLLAASNVRGFAFMLILTTVLDLIVTFLFTHPLLTLLARRPFFANGHALSGFDPKTLGAKVRYSGAGRVTIADRQRAVAQGGTI